MNKIFLLLLALVFINIGLFAQQTQPNQPPQPNPEHIEQMKKQAEQRMKEKEEEFKKKAQEQIEQKNAERGMGNPNMQTKALGPKVDTTADKLTPELLWSLGRIGEFSVSPDGSKIVYEVSWPDLKENSINKELYLISSKGGNPTRLTQTPKSEYHPVWSKDATRIYFIAPDEKEDDQLWVMNADGSGRKQISRIGNGISDFSFAPSYGWIAFKRDVKMGQDLNMRYPDLPQANAKIIDDLMYRHWDSWDDQMYTHVFYQKIENDTLKEGIMDINKGEVFNADDYCISPDEQFIAYSMKKARGKQDAISTNTDVFVYNINTGTSENISSGMPGYDNMPQYSPDGKSIAWLSMKDAGYESDKNSLFIYNFDTKTQTDFTSDFSETLANFTWSGDGKSIYFIACKQATFPLFALDLKTKAIKQLTTGDFDYTNLSAAKDQLIATKMSMSMPAEMFSFDLKAAKETQLTFINKPMLDKIKMGKVEKRWVTTTDKKTELVWMIYPPDFDSNKKYPALLYCQGGPQSPVSQFFSYRWNFQIMAANGYIIVAPNRRGLPGFGEEWNDQIAGEWGGLAMQDYLSAIDSAVKLPFVDSKRLGAVGASFGGYSVYWLAGNHNKRFKTFIAHCGVFNLESWYGTTEEMFFANHDLKGSYWTKPEPKSYQLHSPSNFVGKWDTPLLVIHGAKDFRVPESEGMQAFQAAQLKNIPSRFLYFPEAGHWITKPQDGILWQRVYFEWLDRYLKNDLQGQK
jgi:dipeptidyl aminopeptidase/acylaminoacyl peptidase